MLRYNIYARFLLLLVMVSLIYGDYIPSAENRRTSAAFRFLQRDRRAVETRMVSYGSGSSPGIVQSAADNAADNAAAAPPPEGDKSTTTTTTESGETTTEEPFEGDTTGSDVINTLLSIGGALLNFFQDPSQAISQLIETAKGMMKAGRSLAARGPEYIDSARSLLEEANRLLETARKLSLQTRGVAGAAQRVVNTANRVAHNVLHPQWIIPG